MNFELIRELLREHLSAKMSWLPEGTLYAHSMLLYRSLPSLVSQQFDLALMAPDFGEMYADLIQASPQAPHTLGQFDLFSKFSDIDDHFIVVSPGSRMEDMLWNYQDSDAFGRDYVWPFAVSPEDVVRKPGALRYRRTRADVMKWYVATLSISRDELPWIMDLIDTEGMPILAVVADEGNIVVLFEVDAVDYADWRRKCRMISRYMAELGGPNLEFRVDTLVPLQSGSRERGTILYLA